MASSPPIPFLITIDTEGDDLWSWPRHVTTKNANFLPRFQQLCEKYGFKPTWLTNYEMAVSPDFLKFARKVLEQKQAEIGMHLHAWDSPPIVPLTRDDVHYHPYLIEYSPQVMEDKIKFITDLLESQFQCKMLSHRAGRWAFNATYARLLVKYGYTTDCSVTPHVSWAYQLGDPAGAGGTDYRSFLETPYFVDLDDIARPGDSPLLEVPVSIRTTAFHPFYPLVRSLPSLARRAMHRFASDVAWLRPTGRNLRNLLWIVRRAERDCWPCLEFILHSSELMPGGSPHFPTEKKISALYRDLEHLFARAARVCRGMTLSEFRREWTPS